MIETLAAILAPITPDQFFAEYWGKKPLHIRGTAEKFAGVLDWQGLSQLVSQTGLWTSNSLAMVLDKAELAPPAYCRRGIGREGQETWLADIERVKALLQQGATLALNDIDSLTPALQAVATTLETELGGKAQANLYCSWRGHQAFRVHFDTHDVYAMHLQGRKDWRIYQCPIPAPIRHPAFAGFSDEAHEQMKGALWAELTMAPGDLLYLPRGWYHEALSATAGTFHIAWGVSAPIGVDLVSLMFERAVTDPLFRQSIPPLHRVGPAGVAAHLKTLAARLGALAEDETTLAAFTDFMRQFHFHRGQITLPEDALAGNWAVSGPEIVLIPPAQAAMQGNGPAPKGALLSNGKVQVPVPPGLDRPLSWVLAKQRFSESDFSASFPEMADAARQRFLLDMEAMKVIIRV